MAQQCARWIENYHTLQAQLADAAQEALKTFLGSLQKK
jgi:hypothetical protein